MSRPRKTTRGKKVVEGVPFTAETVARLLGDAGAEAAIDPEKLAAVLNQWRRLAHAERAAIPFKRMHRRFAEVLTELHRDIVPALRQQMLDLSRMAVELAGSSAEGMVPSPREATEAVIALDLLKIAVERCGQSAPLLHPETRVAGVDRWQDFAGPIENLLVSYGASRHAARRFVRAVTPQLTGEAAPSIEAVETLLKRKRPSGRGHRAL